MVFKKCKSGHTKSCLYGEVIDDSNSFCKVLLWYYEVGMTSIFTILLTIYQSLDLQSPPDYFKRQYTVIHIKGTDGAILYLISFFKPSKIYIFKPLIACS